MSNTQVDMKLEIVVIPVSDVDRAKRFYGGLGWRLDADFAAGDDFRVIQFTPPGSGVLGHLRHERHRGGPRLRSGAVPDRFRHRGRPRRIARSRRRDRRGVPRRRRRARGPGRALFVRAAPGQRSGPEHAAIAHSPRSAIRTATAGCSRRSPRGCPDASTRTTRPSPRRPSLRPRSGVRRPRMASTRSGPAASTMRTGRTGTPNTSFAEQAGKELPT